MSHATETLPRGWELHDKRREFELDLDLELDLELELELVVEPEPEPEPEPVPEPVAVAVPVSVPAAAPVDESGCEPEDLASILDARTPLLQRAFGNIRLG